MYSSFWFVVDVFVFWLFRDILGVCVASVVAYAAAEAEAEAEADANKVVGLHGDGVRRVSVRDDSAPRLDVEAKLDIGGEAGWVGSCCSIVEAPGCSYIASRFACSCICVEEQSAL